MPKLVLHHLIRNLPLDIRASKSRDGPGQPCPPMSMDTHVSCGQGCPGFDSLAYLLLSRVRRLRRTGSGLLRLPLEGDLYVVASLDEPEAHGGSRWLDAEVS